MAVGFLVRSRRARLVGAVVLFALFAGGSLAAAFTYRALQDTRNGLDTSRAERRTTRRSVAATDKDVEGQVFALDLLHEQLEEIERQIDAANGDLDTTRRRSASRYTRIPLLTECLNGVASALNAASVGDKRTTVLALLAIAPTCTQAQGRSQAGNETGRHDS